MSTLSTLKKRVVILGSGPAGLTAALYAARAGLAPLVIQGIQAGGQLTTTTMVENFPGFSQGVMGPALMEEMQKQAEKFGAEMLMENAESVDLSAPPFKIKAGDTTIEAQSLIITTGASPKYLDLPSERKLLGRGVSVCATCDGFFFRDKTIFVIGGGDAALEEAITLTRFGKSVTVVHRRDQLRASKILVDRAKATAKLGFVFDSVVEEILDGGGEFVTGIKLKNIKTGTTTEHQADGIFIAIGHKPNTDLFQGQLATNERGYLQAQGVKTSIPGVFAAGDVKDERYRQAIVAAGDGCMAALEAQWFVEQSR
jgi:thioredoxin reductase (NADPH)